MSIKDEIMFDFAVKIPRVIISDRIAIIDYAKRIVSYSTDEIIFHNKKKYTVIKGRNLLIKEIKDERVLITGELEGVDFFEALHKADNKR